jgi:hypothetical protein
MIVLHSLWFVVLYMLEIGRNKKLIAHISYKKEWWKTFCSVSTMLKTYNKNHMLLLQNKVHMFTEVLQSLSAWCDVIFPWQEYRINS